MSDSERPHRRQPIRLPHPWDSPGKNTGVGCHFLLQCMKVKSESEVTLSCSTLSDPMDCSLPGSSAHGIFQARGLEWAPNPASDQPQWVIFFFFFNFWSFVFSFPREVKSLSHVRLCDPMDCSLPGSSVHGILQARILEWVIAWTFNNLPIQIFSKCFYTTQNGTKTIQLFQRLKNSLPPPLPHVVPGWCVWNSVFPSRTHTV